MLKQNWLNDLKNKFIEKAKFGIEFILSIINNFIFLFSYLLLILDKICMNPKNRYYFVKFIFSAFYGRFVLQSEKSS